MCIIIYMVHIMFHTHIYKILKHMYVYIQYLEFLLTQTCLEFLIYPLSIYLFIHILIYSLLIMNIYVYIFIFENFMTCCKSSVDGDQHQDHCNYFTYALITHFYTLGSELLDRIQVISQFTENILIFQRLSLQYSVMKG